MAFGMKMRSLCVLAALVATACAPSSAMEAADFAPGKVVAASESTTKGWPNPVVIKGNKFFDSKTGLEFRVKGMAYYPRPNAGEFANVNNHDWTTDDDEAVWRPHIETMKELGVNTIRLYSVDPGRSHDKFMCACAEAGIYVLVGMAAPCENCALLDELPPKCYPDELFTRTMMVYNAFAVYDNTLGFSIANENNLLRKHKDGGTQTMPCAKALLRDVRNYAATCSGYLREVPIGLDLADILPRELWMEYMDCAADDNEYTRAEWIGFNPYVECDPLKHLTYADSKGLQSLMQVYEKVKFSRPLMFGEFGCVLGENTIDGYENQRAFNDARWMNEEPDMMKQIVGGNVFEFVTEIPNTVAKKLTKEADEGRFGVGYFDPITCDHTTIPCKFVPYPEFENLKKAYTTTKPATLTMDAYKVDRTEISKCPANISSELQPIPNVKALACRAPSDTGAQPVCNGGKSNAGKKVAKTNAPPLGGKANPTNTAPVANPSGGGGDGTTGSPATSVHFAALAATTLSVIATVVLA